MSNKKHTDELNAFLTDKGYVWGPEPEIYNGLSGFYTYAPLGKLLKNNVETMIRNCYQNEGYWEVECPTIMPSIVWEASGHLGGFTDKILKCKKCKSVFRADKLLGELYPDKHVSQTDILSFVKDNEIKCQSCKSEFESELYDHNLMMKTTVGLDVEAFNRPETATTTYLPFNRYQTFIRGKFPFGIFQIGKAFRNELSARQSLLRMREFTQAEAQLFIFSDQKNDFKKYELIKNKEMLLWTKQAQTTENKPETMTVSNAMDKGYFKNQVYAWSVYTAYNLFRSMGIPVDKLRMRQHNDDEKAFYADDAWDIEMNLKSFGWYEIGGIHDRTNYDLKQHSDKSGKSFEVRNERTGEKEIPHIIEIAFGVDRPTFALLDLFYSKEDKADGKTMFKVPYNMAPIKVAVYPLMKKEPLKEKAHQIYTELSKEMFCVYDESGSIGRRYLRAGEQGIPFCITVDYDTLEKGIVTIRDRDTEKQIKVNVSDVHNKIRELINV